MIDLLTVARHYLPHSIFSALPKSYNRTMSPRENPKFEAAKLQCRAIRKRRTRSRDPFCGAAWNRFVMASLSDRLPPTAPFNLALN